MADSARAIIHFPYKSQATGKTYNSILLVRDLIDNQHRFALPGGQVDKNDKTLEDTLKREVNEELGLTVTRSRPIGSIPAARGGTHHFFVATAEGVLNLDDYAKKNGLSREIDALGFYGAGSHNRLPDTMQQGHLLALRGLYRWNTEWDQNNRKPDIQVPSYYMDRWRKIMEGVRKGEGALPRDGNGGWRV